MLKQPKTADSGAGAWEAQFALPRSVMNQLPLGTENLTIKWFRGPMNRTSSGCAYHGSNTCVSSGLGTEDRVRLPVEEMGWKDMKEGRGRVEVNLSTDTNSSLEDMNTNDQLIRRIYSMMSSLRGENSSRYAVAF